MQKRVPARAHPIRARSKICVSVRDALRPRRRSCSTSANGSSNDVEMPSAAFRLFRLTCGYRYPVDFATATELDINPTCGWDPDCDLPRDTIERGDTVHLQPLDGPMIEARVWLDRVHDHIVDENSYGAFVIGFPHHREEAGQEFMGFHIGERITFSASNVVHREQRLPPPSLRRNAG
jgi:hypothetical protein